MDRAQMTGMMEKLVVKLYGSAPVPASEGGWLFHAICEQRRREGDLFWTERRINDLARELGYWPWSVNQIGAAMTKPAAEVEANRGTFGP